MQTTASARSSLTSFRRKSKYSRSEEGFMPTTAPPRFDTISMAQPSRSKRAEKAIWSAYHSSGFSMFTMPWELLPQPMPAAWICETPSRRSPRRPKFRAAWSAFQPRDIFRYLSITPTPKMPSGMSCAHCKNSNPRD